MSDQINRAEGYHIPVLLHETIEQLISDPDGIYIDATFGGGGHSREILKHLGEGGHLFGVDQDADAEANCDIEDDRFTFVRSNFRYIPHFMDFYGIDQVTGILADLGVSSHHLDDEERGFSFRFDAPLDMRMNQSGGATARVLIATVSEEELTGILRNYGEVRQPHKLARLIKASSDAGRLQTIQDLLDTIRPVQPEHDKRGLAKVFQAIRIAVNDEMGALEDLLRGGCELLAPGGRFCVITYHSLEDRPTKNFFRTGHTDGSRETDLYGRLIAPMEPFTRKPITPSEQEIDINPRARSAKLRTGVKISQS